MQKNYLILAHKNPQQLTRMIKTLDDGNSKFFIHLDAKTPIEPFTAQLEDEHIVVYGGIFQLYLLLFI